MRRSSSRLLLQSTLTVHLAAVASASLRRCCSLVAYHVRICAFILLSIARFNHNPCVSLAIAAFACEQLEIACLRTGGRINDFFFDLAHALAEVKSVRLQIAVILVCDLAIAIGNLSTLHDCSSPLRTILRTLYMCPTSSRPRQLCYDNCCRPGALPAAAHGHAFVLGKPKLAAELESPLVELRSNRRG